MRLNTLALGGCKGTTQKGQPCQGKDVYENGYCKHHGGEGKLPRLEYQKAKLLRKAERALKRSKRFERKVAKFIKAHPSIQEFIDRMKARANGGQT